MLSVLQFSFCAGCAGLYYYNLAQTSRNLILSMWCVCSDFMLNTRGLIDFFFWCKLLSSPASEDLSRSDLTVGIPLFS